MERLFNFKYIVIAAIILVIVIATVVAIGNSDNNQSKISYEDAKTTMNALLSKSKIKTNNNVKVDISSDNLGEVALPDISKYPLSVEGHGEINIEMFSSTEKSSKGTDGWLNEVAQSFNNSNIKINGKSVSISVRPIASGLAMDYLTTGKYIPDAFTPSNTLWIDMLDSKGLNLTKIEDSLIGNTAGFLLKEDKYNQIQEKYGEVNLETILKANQELGITIGYTNPYSSSTGLNMLVNMLYTFDNQNPLSETAIKNLNELQKNSPPVALVTAQMRESAAAGLIDVMTMEYQAYINEPKLNSYKYVPMGVRHDSPLYATKQLSEEQINGLKEFVKYCKNKQSQDLGTKYGFNAYSDYKSQDLGLTGSQLYSAQSIWKTNKSGGRPVIAVFVTDVSGSMEGTPITSLRNGLVGASQYIDDTNYIGLVSYANEVTIELPVDKFSGQQRAKFNGAVKSLSAGGSTNTYTAVLQALKMIDDKKQEVPDARAVIFLLSDGDQNVGYSLSKIRSVIEGMDIPIHCIGYNGGSKELGEVSKINEASNIDADVQDIAYQLKTIFSGEL
ncbi:VWA domain-containing protein [uncultured Clostridium sp.]|uniref:VWA domain-containing protein n=1 Tax=uncultured Clostridium sp. TaxID=59620 RepID=UPI002628112F|nr:VWA domain-containing protein [uncultured Clostridium sp.]